MIDRLLDPGHAPSHASTSTWLPAISIAASHSRAKAGSLRLQRPAVFRDIPATRAASEMHPVLASVFRKRLRFSGVKPSCL
jgi:hypothetical protein